jgi:hypothetical protein
MSGRAHRLAARVLLLLAAAGMLSACAYDPYTGTYVPCCAYPYYGYYGSYGYPAYYRYYRYPAPYYGGGYYYR